MKQKFYLSVIKDKLFTYEKALIAEKEHVKEWMSFENYVNSYFEPFEIVIKLYKEDSEKVIKELEKKYDEYCESLAKEELEKADTSSKYWEVYEVETD